MIIDDTLRPWFDAAAKVAARPTSVTIHIVGYLGWWAANADSKSLVIAMSLEAIVIGLIIIDKQEREAERDRKAKAKIDRELLAAVPGARPEIIDECES